LSNFNNCNTGTQELGTYRNINTKKENGVIKIFGY